MCIRDSRSVYEKARGTPSLSGMGTTVVCALVRGGYMKGVANGIFSQYPPLRRVTRKLEQIIREEMDAIGGQERCV